MSTYNMTGTTVVVALVSSATSAHLFRLRLSTLSKQILNVKSIIQPIYNLITKNR